MKNILITGAGGFIGSHLTELCVQKGYKVKAFVHYNSKGDLGWLEGSRYLSGIEVICGDIRDYDSVHGALKGSDTVFHLAALIGIPYSYKSALAYIRTNVEGTYNILEASRQAKVKNILVTSTSEVYGSAQYAPIDEKHPVVGQSPYSATKIAADQLALSYHCSFGLPIKIVRPFNTYGPRQSARAIIPAVITQIIAGNKQIKLGNLAPKRDFTFINDTVKGFLAIATCDALFGEVTNIGNGHEISVKEMVRIISSLMNTKIKVIQDKRRLRPKKSEVDRLCCDNRKLMKYTGWKPEYTIKEGLSQTIEWVKDNVHLYKTRVYNV